jgi:hypothetical protein
MVNAEEPPRIAGSGNQTYEETLRSTFVAATVRAGIRRIKSSKPQLAARLLPH